MNGQRKVTNPNSGGGGQPINSDTNPCSTDVSGKQDDIQLKMVSVCEMYRLSKDLNDQDKDKAKLWEIQVKGNGLCGGWVEVFKKYPEWMRKSILDCPKALECSE